MATAPNYGPVGPGATKTMTEAEMYAQPDVIAMYKSLGLPVPTPGSQFTQASATPGGPPPNSYMATPEFQAWRAAQFAGTAPGTAPGATPPATQPQGGYTPPTTPAYLAEGAAQANPAAPSWGGTWGGQPGIYGRTGGGAGAFQGADEFSRLAWQSDPAQAFTRYVSQEANPNSHYERWLQNEQQRTLRDYVDASRGQHDLYIGDYLQQQAPSLVARYTQLPGFQQGMNVAPNFAGRRL